MDRDIRGCFYMDHIYEIGLTCGQQSAGTSFEVEIGQNMDKEHGSTETSGPYIS